MLWIKVASFIPSLYGVHTRVWNSKSCPQLVNSCLLGIGLAIGFLFTPDCVCIAGLWLWKHHPAGDSQNYQQEPSQGIIICNPQPIHDRREKMAKMKLKELESHLQQVDEFESPKILLGKLEKLNLLGLSLNSPFGTQSSTQPDRTLQLACCTPWRQHLET